MDTSLIITIIGTVLTAIATFVTIYYSFVVRKYKKEILADINRVNFIKVSEILKNIQNETRKLLYPKSPLTRGRKNDEVITAIQKYIDESLAIINLDEGDGNLRQKIIDAQQILRKFIKSDNNKEELISDFHSITQNCISIAKSNANKFLEN